MYTALQKYKGEFILMKYSFVNNIINDNKIYSIKFVVQ